MRHRTLALVLSATAASVLAAPACSSDAPAPAGAPDASVPSDAASASDAPPGSDGAAPSDGGADGSLPDATREDGGSCSGVATSGLVVQALPPGVVSGTPEIVWTTCAAKATITAGTPPKWSLEVGAGLGYYRSSLAGYKTTLTAIADSNVLKSAPGAIPIQLVQNVPGFDATKAHVVIALGTANGGCQKDGTTVAAPGHPEATVTYIDKNGSPTGGAAMTNDGLAVISGIDPTVGGGTLDPQIAANPGTCTISYTFATKSVPLVAGTVAIQNVESKP